MTPRRNKDKRSLLQIHLLKLHSLKQAAGGISLNMNANKTKFEICKPVQIPPQKYLIF